MPAKDWAFNLPDAGEYGVGMIFLPDQRDQRRRFEKTLEKIIAEEGQKCLGWRKVPTDNMYLGETAKASEPFVRQVFIGRDPGIEDELAFERKLYVIRRRAENAIRYAGLAGGDFFYVPSMSSRTLIYKGMLTPRQVTTFYPDLSRALGGNRHCRGALSFQHQYFSKLGSGASVSLFDSQWRDQYAARQRKLDACAPRHVGHGTVW